MKCTKYYAAINQWVHYTTRAMFGGVGLFYQGSIFALIDNEQLILRGGGKLSDKMRHLGCKQYRKTKKRTISSVDYFNVTQLYEEHNDRLGELVIESAKVGHYQKTQQEAHKVPRIRELINLQFNIERMLSKVGVNDCNTLKQIGAVYAYALLKQRYGMQISDQLLWKLYGAIEGVHWWLLQEPTKKRLLSQYRTISFDLHTADGADLTDVENK